MYYSQFIGKETEVPCLTKRGLEFFGYIPQENENLILQLFPL